MSALDRPPPRRVAFLHDAQEFAGMEVLLLSVLRHLDWERYRPFVVVPGYEDPHRTSPQQLIEALAEIGVPVARPRPPGDTRVVSSIRELVNTTRLLRDERPAVAHVYTRHAETARKGTIAAALARIPALVRTEHLPPTSHMSRFARYTVRPFDWVTDSIITDSDADRDEQLQVLGRSPAKVVRSHCGIDTHRFDPDHDVRQAKARIGLDPATPVVGTVGRMHAQKGQTYFLQAAADVLSRHRPTNFVIVGDGELRDDLHRQATELGIEDSVHFVGFQADYVPYMEAMDIGVMPSLWEGFSISMLEFMALGKPMVVSDHASFREALQDGEQALVVPMADAPALGGAIRQLLEDPDQAARLGRAALDRVRREFSIEVHVGQMMDLYDTLLR